MVGKPEVIPPTVDDLVLRRSASNRINTRMRHTRDLTDEQWQTLDPLSCSTEEFATLPSYQLPALLQFVSLGLLR
jgi:hypothetical protein